MPLVKELQFLLDGVEIHIQTLCKSVLVRCALLCVACDIYQHQEKCVDFLDIPLL